MKFLGNIVLIIVLATIVVPVGYLAWRADQPMDLPQFKGYTYYEYLAWRKDALRPGEALPLGASRTQTVWIPPMDQPRSSERADVGQNVSPRPAAPRSSAKPRKIVVSMSSSSASQWS